MKNMIKIPVILVGLMLFFAGTTQTAKAQYGDVSLQSFYDELSPYGTWIKDPQYGYVWRPDVDQDEFRPYYTNGRWAMTEYGNTWVSNYDWGWAPFHYGRWVYNRYNSWVWLPDTVWGPAWVSWRSGNGHYGWAPLGPSISIGINFGRGGYRVPDMCWNFIPYNNIYYNSYPRYYGGSNRTYIKNTVIINNTYVNNNRTYYTGPRADEVRRATNQNVTVYNVNRSSRAGATGIVNNNINIYNPRPVRGSNNNDAAPRNAVQGSINRGTIASRDNGNSTSSRVERGGNGNYQNNSSTNRGSVNGNMTRPARGENDAVGNLDNNRGMKNRVGVGASNNNSIPDVNSRASRDNNATVSERATRSQPSQNQVQPQQRMERPQQQEQATQRVERSREMPQQRVERSQPVQQQAPQQRMEQRPQQQATQRVENSREMPQQRTERSQPVQQQAPQQRMEQRPQQQQAPQRVERTQSAPPQRSSGSTSEGRNGRSESGGRPTRGGN